MVQVEFLDFRINQVNKGLNPNSNLPSKKRIQKFAQITGRCVTKRFQMFLIILKFLVLNLPNSAKSGHHGNRSQRVILLVLLERNQ